MVFLQWLCRKVWESEIIVICDSNGYVIVSVAWYTYTYRPLKAELMVHYDNSVHVSCHIHSTWTNHSPSFFSSIIPITIDQTCCSQWLPPLASAARLLRSWVRIPPGARMFVCCECCVLSGRGLCDVLITCPEESYRLWRIIVCDQENSKMRRLYPATGVWKIRPNGL